MNSTCMENIDHRKSIWKVLQRFKTYIAECTTLVIDEFARPITAGENSTFAQNRNPYSINHGKDKLEQIFQSVGHKESLRVLKINKEMKTKIFKAK